MGVIRLFILRLRFWARRWQFRGKEKGGSTYGAAGDEAQANQTTYVLSLPIAGNQEKAARIETAQLGFSEGSRNHKCISFASRAFAIQRRLLTERLTKQRPLVGAFVLLTHIRL